MTDYYNTQKLRSHVNGYKIKLRLIQERGMVCEVCGKPQERIEMHHIVELWNGGGFEDSNLQLVCYPCHKKLSIESMKRWCKAHPVKYYKDGVLQNGNL